MSLVAPLSLLLLGLAPQRGLAEEDDVDNPRIFALPMVRDTREQAAVAEEHLRAGRMPEAIQVLQRILEGHSQEVLPPSADGKNPSTYPGAADWALTRLLELPEAAREEYRKRFEPRAGEALERARLAPERSALAAIPRQWPLTRAAVEAWWALGDLELESGHLQAAELAWHMAQDRAERLGFPTTAGQARLSWLSTRGGEHAAGPGAAPTIPRGDAEAWTTPLDLAPFVRRTISIGANLQPIAKDDLVFAGSTLRLYAMDAFTGEPRWQAGPPRGWGTLGAQTGASGLYEGINYELYLTPAVGDGVVLAVMQQPFAENENEQWQGIPIMTAIPERRLHAYDLDSGRELWNHSPKLTSEGTHLRWDGGGTYAQRMMIAGSPVIVGERALVPCYRMQGRIDYHVACYEVQTGELLWSTLVISGQRERNMFGRPVREFCAAPLVVAGDRVLAQTELGTLAALDLFTGRIEWQTTYRQIPLPKTKNYNAPPRPLTWRLAPPVVVGEWLVATPSDSNEIVALRIADGSKLWAYTEDSLQALDRQSSSKSFDLLVGADGDTVYLSGEKLAALQKPGGLGNAGAPFVARWTKVLDHPDSSPRAVLTADAVIAPSALKRAVFDRRSGAELPALSGSWNRGEAGSLWVADGALFSLSAQGLSGYFDWTAQLERARRMTGPDASVADLGVAAELFLRRGRLAVNEGSLDVARTSLEEARGLFARLRAANAVVDARDELACARALAEVLATQQRPDQALAILREARSLANLRVELAALLFQEERILRARGGPARLAILDEIQACWGELSLPEETRLEAAQSWLGTNAGRDNPVADPGPIATALWVAIERATEHERASELEAAFLDLHSALALAGDLVLAPGVPLADLLRARIERLRALPGALEAYEEIETRADALLTQARASGDAASLDAVCERYPHSRAADEALGELLARAVAGHEPRSVVRLVGLALARGGLRPARETELLLVLAQALGQQGNAAFEQGLVSSLARQDPSFVSTLPAHGGKTLGELAEALGKELVEPARAPVRFDPGVVSTGRPRPGLTIFLGTLLPRTPTAESAPFELQLYATKEEILAYSSTAPGQPLWRRALARPPEGIERKTAFAPGCFVQATRDGLECLDERGEVRWSSPLSGDYPRSLGESSGVVVALSDEGSVRAFDSLLGLPLWDRALGPGGSWSGPTLGDGHAAFFSQLPSLPPRVVVLDLFRGVVTADFQLGGLDARTSLERTAWIAAGRLVAPSFQVRPAQLSAFALEGGRRAWTIEFGREEEFHAVARCEGRSYPITLSASLGTGGNGGVYELDESTGTVRRVVPLKAGERLAGIEGGGTVTLSDPFLFAFTYSDSERSVPIRAIHLPNGILWTWSLSIASPELYDGRNLPMPAVSADCVAIAYPARKNGGDQGTEATIVFVDKRAGKKVDTLILGKPFAQSSRLELRGLGEALLVLGKGPSRGSCLEILERLR